MIEKLIKIQADLKAPKNQFNKFGNFNYRSLEDIQEAVKPLLYKHGLFLSISDEVVEKSGVLVNIATVRVSDGEKTITTQAEAGIALNKKGMDISQTFGSASTYSRKYAMGGMFLIDDTKDADSMDNKMPELQIGSSDYLRAITHIKKGGAMSTIEQKFKVSPEVKKSIAEKLSQTNKN